jgi:hypothetical protein
MFSASFQHGVYWVSPGRGAKIGLATKVMSSGRGGGVENPVGHAHGFRQGSADSFCSNELEMRTQTSGWKRVLIITVVVNELGPNGTHVTGRRQA